ncbi:unnamed protein product [Owenia fusiformis]|nr:unnamed protein product [Owenia fusiformis]
MGPAWKGKGDKLGCQEEIQDSEKPHKGKKDGSSRDAACVRRLPDHIENPPTPPQQPKPKTIRKIVLPDEPEVGAPGSVNIAFRTPFGRVFKRRFLYSEKIQILLDFMATLGFPERVYMLSSSYPRHCISSDPDKTVLELELTKDLALNIDERDD